MKLHEEDQLIYKFIDGVASQAEAEQLQVAMKASPELRSLYLKSVRIDSHFKRLNNGQENLNNGVIPFAEMVRTKQGKRAIKQTILAVAAIITISLVSLHLLKPATNDARLAFKVSPSAKYKLSHSSDRLSTEALSMAPGSSLSVSEGAVELLFSSGVRSVIFGPAEITMQGKDKLSLSQGVAWFHVPAGAEGFTVVTPELKVVDLGTKFGVNARPNEYDQVHVFEGRVEVTALQHKKETEVVTAGNARFSDFLGSIKKTSLMRDLFTSELPKNAVPVTVFEERFDRFDVTKRWEITGSGGLNVGDYRAHPCAVNTVGSSDHSDVHFNQLGKEIGELDQGFFILGIDQRKEVNSISTIFPAEANQQYSIYFRHASSRNKDRVTTVSIYQNGKRIEQQEKASKVAKWTSEKLTFTTQNSGDLRVVFEDQGSATDPLPHTFLDSILITKQAREKTISPPSK